MNRSSDVAQTKPTTPADMTVAGKVDARNASPRSEGSAHLDPVEDLKTVIKRLPFGSLALSTGELGFRMTGATARVTIAVVAFEIRTASSAVSLGLRAADACLTQTLHVVHYIPGSTLALQMGGSAVSYTQRFGNATLSGSARIARALPGGPTTLQMLEQVLQTVGFLAAAAESPGFSNEATPPLLVAGTERAETLKLEAAARLAEMLTRAEQLAKRGETIEWTAEAAAWAAVRPDVSKIALALKAQRPRLFSGSIQRVFAVCDSLSKSLWVCTRTFAVRLGTATTTFVRAFRRELRDLKKQAPGRAPGWRSAWEAYSRLVFSSWCEAFLELRPDGRGIGMRRDSALEGETGGSSEISRQVSEETLPPVATKEGGLDFALGDQRPSLRRWVSAPSKGNVGT